MKHIKALVMLSALALSLSSCGILGRKAPVQRAVDKHITILAVNDMHAAIDNFPRLGYIVDSLRVAYPGLLVVSGGDNQTGNPVNDQYPEKGLPMIELMNALKFDVSAVGNHEFDTKHEGFAKLTHKAQFPFLCANLTIPAGSDFKIRPYHIFTLTDGTKVAVASILDINSGGIPDSHPDNVTGFTFHDPIKTAKSYTHLKDSADVFIYLNHFGFENDVELANQLPTGVTPLIIGGHSHTKVDTDQIHNGVMITQAASKLKFATLIQLTVKPDGSVDREMKLISVGKEGNVREDLREMVRKYNDAPALKEVIARSQDEFTSYEQLGYLMVDALRAGVGTQIALINPGGVRIDKLSKGDVTLMDVYSLDPFGNEAIVFNLTGQEILNLHYAAFERDERLPIYPSGMTSHYYLNEDGSLKEVKLFLPDGTPMNLAATYTVSVNSYISAAYKYDHKDAGVNKFVTTADNMIEYLKSIKTIPSYRAEKRVTVFRP
ncbi:bifunctional UDP-sugar hydrolase/5'-nucleotidase [Porphyromonas sp.]|uniref:bifunctional metallophosphatase/5'-nucleotidase n=1 Tax=Porphyromonas sp. TaxID=1924944 RepID=UPI0026DD7B4A|nr:bifunctional UDP-sugar hydrolase/5'-nucleotidase [Porphyromonas sp.]MDO4695118.1 bifunctional UDP-sugar hydrolase/5'-nucleotidase [Porphyromonas sp.]MDO4770237.1 bifunctional UDP-sugar hydrolase/5'-nucleotidase [Porphyromonas sp.]